MVHAGNTQAIHSSACLNLHHSDIQSTAQKSPCANTFLRPSQKKKQGLSLSGVNGSWWSGQKDTRDNGHVRQQSAQCDMLMVVPCVKTQRGPAPYTRRRAMQRSQFDIRGGDAGAGGMSISSGSSGASGMGASSSSSDASAMAHFHGVFWSGLRLDVLGEELIVGVECRGLCDGLAEFGVAL